MSTTATTEEQLKKMYEGQLTSQKEQLTTDYNSALSDLDAQKEQAQKAAQQSASQATARAQRAVVNNEEYYAANGLTSGARAQARLAQENQLQANLTNIQAAQQAADAEVERQRGLLSQEYASAIRKAQADNDMALAKALYEQAQKEEEKLLAKQEAAAALIAQTGDYSRLGALYGLTDEEVQKLNGNYRSGSGGGGGQNWDNEGYDKATIAKLQAALGFSGSDVDGLWGPNSRKAALERWGTSTLEGALEAYNDENSKGELKSSFRDPFHTGGSYYTQVLADMQALKSKGQSSEIGALLKEAKAYLTASEYMTLYNKYRDGRI